MKYVDAECRFIDDKTEDWIADPFFLTADNRKVLLDYVFQADWKDGDGRHEAVEKAARDGKKEVVCLNCGDDQYYFVNESRLRKVRGK